MTKTPFPATKIHRIATDSTNPAKIKTAALCGFVLEGTDSIIGLDGVSPAVKRAIRDAAGEMRGKMGKIATFNTLGEMPAKRIMAAGLGAKKNITSDTLRFVSGMIAKKAQEMNLVDFSIMLPAGMCDEALAASQITEGARLSLYSYNVYKSGKKQALPKITILAPKSPKITEAVRTAARISEGVIFAKDLGNMPPNECTPDALGRIAKKMCAGTKLKCRVLGKAELQKRGFGGISAVGRGSRNEPVLIIMEYRGAGRQKPTILVGKAVTFDTGGISLKPGEKMDEMKFDKCGGCTVLGIMKTAANLGIRKNIVGIIPAVENMPGGESYRPGDIIKLYSGKTAEILNTDAEGRLILADAMAYGEKYYKPKEMIDFATLTGACIVALGTNVAGMVSNNDSLAGNIRKASLRTAEEVWQLPLNADYMDMIKSGVADMKNMGTGRAAGTIAAAAFLKNAIGDVPWVHLDIAGTAWTQASTKPKPYNPKGATGFGVRLIIEHLSG